MSLMITTTLMDSFVSVCCKGINGAYTTGEYLVYGTHPVVAATIQKLDIESKINTTRLTIEENKLLISSFKSLSDIEVEILMVCNKIDTVLLKIQNELAVFNSSYFKYWKTPNCDSLLVSLEHLSYIFDQKFTVFLSLLNVYSHREPNLSEYPHLDMSQVL